MNSKQTLIESQDTSTINQEDSGFFNLMRKVGTIGRYQYSTFALWCVMVYLAGGLTLMVPFLFYQDSYQCDSSLSDKACLDFVCSLPESQQQKYIPQVTIDSLANKFGNFRCEPQKSHLTTIITIMYGGSLLGVLFMSLFGDALGRKTLMMVNLLMMMIGMAMTIWCVNLWMAGIGISLCVFGGKNNFNLCVIFMTQTTTKTKRQVLSVLIHACYCSGGLFNVLWYYVISDFYTVLIYCYGIPSLIVAFCLIFFVKDTPICLLANYTPEKAYQSLAYIARVNGVTFFDLTIEQIRQLQQQYKRGLGEKSKRGQKQRRFTIFDLFRYKSLRAMTVLLVVMDCTLDLEYYTPTLMLDQFKFSIFINGLVIQSSLILASLLSALVVFRFKRKIFNSVSYGVVMLCALGLVFIWDQNKEEITDVWSNIAVLGVVFLNQLVVIGEFNLFLVYINELYPTQVRIIGIGFIKIFGGLSQTLAALLISLCLNTGFRIMIIFSILAGVCVICSRLLPETFGKMPAQVIEELKIDSDRGDLEEI